MTYVHNHIAVGASGPMAMAQASTTSRTPRTKRSSFPCKADRKLLILSYTSLGREPWNFIQIAVLKNATMILERE
jgi:hypothetical protein